MGKPCSMDLRERISRDIASGHSRRAASRVFGVSVSTAVRPAADDRDRGAVTLASGPFARDDGQTQAAHCVSGRDRPRRARPYAEGPCRSAGGDAWRIGASLFDPPGPDPRRVPL